MLFHVVHPRIDTCFPLDERGTVRRGGPNRLRFDPPPLRQLPATLEPPADTIESSHGSSGLRLMLGQSLMALRQRLAGTGAPV